MIRYSKSIIEGFHGTSLKIAQKIKKSKKFKPSSDGYLGKGVYFFDGDSYGALNWAKRDNEECGVISALIKLKNCLNLTTTKGCKEFEKTVSLLTDEIYQRTGCKFENLDIHAIIDILKITNCIDTVCAYRDNESYKLYNSEIGNKLSYGKPKYICVKNPECIEEIELALSTEDTVEL